MHLNSLIVFIWFQLILIKTPNGHPNVFVLCITTVAAAHLSDMINSISMSIDDASAHTYNTMINPGEIGWIFREQNLDFDRIFLDKW